MHVDLHKGHCIHIGDFNELEDSPVIWDQRINQMGWMWCGCYWNPCWFIWRTLHEHWGCRWTGRLPRNVRPENKPDGADAMELKLKSLLIRMKDIVCALDIPMNWNVPQWFETRECIRRDRCDVVVIEILVDLHEGHCMSIGDTNELEAASAMWDQRISQKGWTWWSCPLNIGWLAWGILHTHRRFQWTGRGYADLWDQRMHWIG